MSRRKRGHDEMQASEPLKETSLLEKLRNMWEFASLNQYIYTFGDAVKIDKDLDIEELETECLKPGLSDKLEEIGLTLLKWISSHRGLTLEIWDEYTRRQYLSKAPDRNPYGDDEEPNKFRDFDIFQKIRVLHQLSVWTLWNPDRMREKMDVSENDHVNWRVDELGFDHQLRSYFLLDDNRLYRRTDPPIPPAPKAKPKANSLKAQAARRRASKRMRVEESRTPEVKMEGDDALVNSVAGTSVEVDTQPIDTFGGFKWELVAITVAQYQEFIESLKKTRDEDEMALRDYLREDIIPVIEKGEESQRRKIERKERELLNLEKLAGAKRSSRLANKHERERHDREAAEAEQKHAADLAEAHLEQQRQLRMEQDRQSRMMTREQRIKDREYKRLLHEEELAKIEEEAKKVEAGEARGSERHLKAQMEKRKKDLEDLSAEEEWVFDCSGCGIYGKNIDDGAHSVACEKCGVWQHSKCLDITKAEAEKDDFHFICKDCKQRIEDAKKPKISLKFRAGLSSSPTQPKSEGPAASRQEPSAGIGVPKKRGPGRPPGTTRPTSQGSQSNGHAVPHPTQPTRRNGSAYFQQPFLNGYGSYTGAQQPVVQPQKFSPYDKGYAQAGPASNPPAMFSPNGLVARPGSSSGQTGSFAPPSNSSTFPRPSSAHGQYSPYYNGVPYQYQNYSSQSPPPRPASSYSPNGYPAYDSTSHTVNNTNNARMPSPVLNRPTMSPTQGNQDAGHTAGFPQSSPGTSYVQPPGQQRTPGTFQSHGALAYYSQTTPGPLSRSPNMNHMSGLSPTKHSPSFAPPTHTLQKSSMSPPPHGPGASRSVSGTPIFPPAENLAPSPKQLSKSPVPTPSKNASPKHVGDAELKRVNVEAAEAMSQPQQAGQ